MNTNHEEITLALPASMTQSELELVSLGLRKEGWSVQDPDCFGTDAAGNHTIYAWR